MDQKAKVRLAEEIGQRIRKKYGEVVLFGTLSGSVARGEDTELSDMEVVFLTRDKIRLPGRSPDGLREFLYRGLQLQIEFKTKEEALENLRQVNPIGRSRFGTS